MKRIAYSSREARQDLRSDLARREADVIDGLERYRAHHRSDPTAYELLRWMQIENPAIDLNAIRPRLTELKDAGRVSTTGKRRCAITEKRVYTWAAVSPNPVPTPYLEQSREIPAHQEALF